MFPGQTLNFLGHRARGIEPTKGGGCDMIHMPTQRKGRHGAWSAFWIVDGRRGSISEECLGGARVHNKPSHHLVACEGGRTSRSLACLRVFVAYLLLRLCFPASADKHAWCEDGRIPSSTDVRGCCEFSPCFFQR